MTYTEHILRNTDWPLLERQLAVLYDLLDGGDLTEEQETELGNIIGWAEFVQSAAEKDGYCQEQR